MEEYTDRSYFGIQMTYDERRKDTTIKNILPWVACAFINDLPFDIHQETQSIPQSEESKQYYIARAKQKRLRKAKKNLENQ